MFISCIIATKDRHDEVTALIKSIGSQTSSINEIIIVDSSDKVNYSLDYYKSLKSNQCLIKYIKCEIQGLTLQRNVGLKNLDPAVNYVFFFDDDLTLDKDYTKEIVTMLEQNKHIGGVSGYLLKDGNRSYKKPDGKEIISTKSLYGCNMCYRYEVIKDMGFDEKLKFYAWMEDWDFSFRVSRKAELAFYTGALAFHNQVPKGRVNNKKLGFMLIANRHYLHKKNSVLSYKDYIYYILQIFKNIVLFYKKERRNRLIGNLIAFSNTVFLNKSMDLIVNLSDD